MVTEKEMLEWLASYRTMLTDMTSMIESDEYHSPWISDEQHGYSTPLDVRRNRRIERIDELEAKLEAIEEAIDKIEPYSPDGYLVMKYKWLEGWSFEKMESEWQKVWKEQTANYSKATIFRRYKEGKMILLNILNETNDNE